MPSSRRAESQQNSAVHGEEDSCCRNSLYITEVPNGLGALKALNFCAFGIVSLERVHLCSEALERKWCLNG